MKRIITLIAALLGLCLGLGQPDASNGYSLNHPEKTPTSPIIKLITQCKVKNPYHYKNLTIFPIFANSESNFEYLTLEQGIKQDYVEIKELGSGQVNIVQVKNKSRHYIFGLAGELIIGAKQDRMLKEDILIPPFSKWLEIPVYCTEHGRWTEQTQKFQSRGIMMPGILRAKAMKTESQDEVWAGVDEVHADLAVTPKTRAFKEVYESPNIQEKSQPYLKELLQIPKKGKNIIGVIVAVDDEIICADLFANPSLFERMWEKLLRSYVIDALAKPTSDGVSLDEAKYFLNSITDGTFENQTTPGAGRLVRINSDRGSGSALLFRNDVVHLDLFPESIIDFEHDDGPAPRLDIRRERLHG
jgi:ARG and Rhodanese-Phosphatase-superfamily-associated Protein domain